MAFKLKLYHSGIHTKVRISHRGVFFFDSYKDMSTYITIHDLLYAPLHFFTLSFAVHFMFSSSNICYLASSVVSVIL